MNDLLKFSATYTDLYQLTMSQVYYQHGRQKEEAVFDYYFRKLPFDGGYAVFAGLEDLLDALENFVFSEEDLHYLKVQGFRQDFIDFLKDFRFKGTIYSVAEGDVVFPVRPILQVEGNIIEAQLIETFLLNVLNFQTLIATKASRIKLAAGAGSLADFGLRRAQGPGGYYASRAAIVGGFGSTSNVVAGKDYDIPVSGTMAHSYIQSYDDELTAFRHFAESHPQNCILLVDTYDTLKSGVPNTITVAREMEEKGHRLKGIRLDSGDLAYLSKESRRMLDEAGLHYVIIAASNQLDEHVIKSLKEQQAPIDIFGVGTNLVTGHPDAALDGVYKLTYSNDQPRIKLSESIKKTTLPHKKQVYRLKDHSGNWIGGDMIALREETDPEEMFDPFEPFKSLKAKNFQKEPLLHKVIEKGNRIAEKKTLAEIAAYSQKRISLLPEEYKRFHNPHIYKVGLTERLRNERDILIAKHKSTK